MSDGSQSQSPSAAAAVASISSVITSSITAAGSSGAVSVPVVNYVMLVFNNSPPDIKVAIAAALGVGTVTWGAVYGAIKGAKVVADLLGPMGRSSPS